MIKTVTGVSVLTMSDLIYADECPGIEKAD